MILEKAPDLGPGGSTAVTAILIDSKRLLVANVGDSRAVLSRGGVALQLSVDHEPSAPTERGNIEASGGFVSNMPGSLVPKAPDYEQGRGFLTLIYIPPYLQRFWALQGTYPLSI